MIIDTKDWKWIDKITFQIKLRRVVYLFRICILHTVNVLLRLFLPWPFTSSAAVYGYLAAQISEHLFVCNSHPAANRSNVSFIFKIFVIYLSRAVRCAIKMTISEDESKVFGWPPKPLRLFYAALRSVRPHITVRAYVIFITSCFSLHYHTLLSKPDGSLVLSANATFWRLRPACVVQRFTKNRN